MKDRKGSRRDRLKEEGFEGRYGAMTAVLSSKELEQMRNPTVDRAAISPSLSHHSFNRDVSFLTDRLTKREMYG